MKKYQKLYQLKQIVKAYQEYSKYARLSRKKRSPKEYEIKYEEAAIAWRNSIKETTINQYIDGRILNISYSLLKGKQYPQIENSVKQQNELKEYEWKEIADIMSKYKDEENTCIIPTPPIPTTQVNFPKVKKVEVINE